MSHRTNVVLCVAWVSSVLAVGGCGQGTAVEEYYILEAEREASLVTTPIDATLQIGRLSVDSAFASKNLIYRLEQSQYESDYYREFLISPAAMITEQTRHWLADSGLFKQVLPSSSQVAPTYTLEGSVTALYGDFRDKSAPVAVLEIRWFLIQHQNADGGITFSQTYKGTHPVSARTADALMVAFNRDLADVLTRLEADLRQSLAP